LSVEATLSALAEPTRFGVVSLLREGPRRAGELALALDCAPPAMTRHLRALREAGLVREEPLPGDRRVHVYALQPAPFVELSTWADEAAALWTDQLEGFAAHVRGRS
jgi:DNA-binding transcriptional ArsR family regulator